jgi:hypothetical protein
MLKLKPKKGVWVDYPNATGVRLKIRPVYFSESLRILSDTKEKRIVENFPIDVKDPSKRGPQVVDDYNDGVFLQESFDRTLEAWEGIEIEQEEGEPALGPKEIKQVLFDNDALREFVFKTARALVDAESKQQGEERKNSSSLPLGSESAAS